MITSLAIKKRNRILRTHRRLVMTIRDIEQKIEQMLADQDPQWDKLEEKRNFLYREIEPLVERYWKWIPPVLLGQCPFCDTDFYHRFDPIDLKGFWWMDRTQRPVSEPRSCPHFCLLTGAVNLNGLPVEAGVYEALPGPDRPYVIPRILTMPTMIAVMSVMPMHCGYTAYPIVYFAETPPPPGELTQGWAEKEYHYYTEDGEEGWDSVEDEYDFNLVPWTQESKLCLYEDGDLKCGFSFRPDHPIMQVQGTGKEQVVVEEELRFRQ